MALGSRHGTWTVPPFLCVHVLPWAEGSPGSRLRQASPGKLRPPEGGCQSGSGSRDCPGLWDTQLHRAVPLDAEETVAVEKAGGVGGLRGFPGALSPSPRGAPESRVPWPREDKPSRFCRKLSGDGRPWPDILMWKPCWFCPLVLAAGAVPLLDTSLPLHRARWLLPLS